MIKNFLEPAGDRFVEELVYRFLLIRGDTLGGSMRNAGGLLAQQQLSRAIIATLSLKGLRYRWLDSKNLQWYDSPSNDTNIETSLRGLSWQHNARKRILIYNLKVDIVKSNVDLCLFDGASENIENYKNASPETYLALGELKGGIDPAGADEHWKTARTALERVREAFARNNLHPSIFFIGAAIEKRMAGEIWSYLQSGLLANAANLNENAQMTSISRWLCNI